MNGLLIIDKPSGMTSRDVVDRAKLWFPRRTRLGHTGTLDPLATGVLVLCIGTATRLSEYIQDQQKSYLTRIQLGAVSDTDDADGTITIVECTNPVALTDLRKALEKFRGVIDQVPPSYSAVKIDGKRAHDVARKGKPVDLTHRPVRIDSIEIRSYEWPFLELEIHCGKGTYIRSLARDLGAMLGCGGFVTVLRRTRVGRFLAEAGVTLDAELPRARKAVLPVSEAVAHLPRMTVTNAIAAKLEHGNFAQVEGEAIDELAIFDPAGELVGVASLGADGLLRPKKILLDGQLTNRQNEAT